MLRRFFGIVLAISFAVLSVSNTEASILVDFDDVATFVTVDGFYNGGTSSDSLSGPNLGVDFLTGDWITTTGFGETSAPNFAYSSSGSGFVNVGSGFASSFSFKYGAFVDSTVFIFDDINGTGNILATQFLGANNPFNPFEFASINFAGTAKSVVVSSGGAQFGWDDLVFGSNNAIPEPGSLLVWGVLGLAGVGMTNRRRKS